MVYLFKGYRLKDQRLIRNMKAVQHKEKCSLKETDVRFEESCHSYHRPSQPLFTLPWQSARRIEVEPNPIGFSSSSVLALDVYIGTAYD